MGFLFGIVLLAVPLWWISYPETTFRHNVKSWHIYSSQLAGIIGFTLFAISLVLSTRLTWLEDLFGGLDKVYHTHHTIGKIAFSLLLFHPVILATRWIPQNTIKALQYLLPFHRRLAIDLGSWAFLIFILLMLLTLVIKIPYDKWKFTHKMTGVVFLLLTFHIFLLEQLVAANPLLSIYLALFAALGILSILYKIVFFRWLAAKKPYKVEKVHRLNEKVMEVTLEPKKDYLQFVPGQFCFVNYKDPSISSEAHPFTICSTSDSHEITIIVKALGDYTNHLYKNLEEGINALVEGPYGRFTFRTYNQPQIWIAGGVGIAPFISWVEDLKKGPIPPDMNIDLFYCVNKLEESIHRQKFRKFENEYQGFSFHLECADKKGFFSARQIDDLQGREIFICGPKEMRRSLLKEFRELKVPKEYIHFEDFDFI